MAQATMQRRHYEMIAAVMLYARPEAPKTDKGTKEFTAALATWARAVNEFSRQLTGTNDRFDSARFKRACGMEE